MDAKILKAKLTRYKNWPIKAIIINGQKAEIDYGRRKILEDGTEEFELLYANETLQPPTTQDYFYGDEKHVLFLYKKDFEDYSLITNVDTDTEKFSLDLKNREKWAVRMANKVEKTLRPDESAWYESAAFKWIAVGFFMLLGFAGMAYFLKTGMAQHAKLVENSADIIKDAMNQAGKTSIIPVLAAKFRK